MPHTNYPDSCGTPRPHALGDLTFSSEGDEHTEDLAAFDRPIPHCIANEFAIRPCVNPQVNGVERTDLIAVKRLSNLASGQGEVAESRQLPDTFFREAGGKRIARDQYLLDGLRRLGLLEAVAHDGRGKGKLEWLLLHRQRLELPKRRRVYACEAALMAG